MYKCVECGHIFEEGEQKQRYEDNGEMWQVCPICGGDFEEAETCEVCGAGSEKLYGGVCSECISKYEHDPETCCKASQDEKETVKINAFLAEMFTASEIETILIDALKEQKNVDCKDFIESDKEWFGGQIARLK